MLDDNKKKEMALGMMGQILNFMTDMGYMPTESDSQRAALMIILSHFIEGEIKKLKPRDAEWAAEKISKQVKEAAQAARGNDG